MPVLPATAFRWAIRGLALLGPTTLLVLIAWGFRWIPDERPVLVLMVYLMLLLGCAAAGSVAVIAATQMTVQQAFMAGFATGERASHVPRQRSSAPLRLVE